MAERKTTSDNPKGLVEPADSVDEASLAPARVASAAEAAPAPTGSKAEMKKQFERADLQAMRAVRGF